MPSVDVHNFIELSQYSSEDFVLFFPILQLKKLSYREIKQLATGHITNKLRTQYLNQEVWPQVSNYHITVLFLCKHCSLFIYNILLLCVCVCAIVVCPRYEFYKVRNCILIGFDIFRT